MSQISPTSAAAGPAPTDLHSARERFLAETAAKREADLAAPPPPALWKRALPFVTVAGLALTLATLLVARPEWVFPKPPVPPAPTVQAMMRAVHQVAGVVTARAEREGRAPASLSAVGLPDQLMHYEVQGPRRYALALEAGAAVVVLTVDLDAPPAEREQVRVDRRTP